MGYKEIIYRLQMYLRTYIPVAAGIITALAGMVVLIGWQFDSYALTTFGLGGDNMKVNAALSFIFSGFALILLQHEHRKLATLFARIFSASTALLGLAVLFQYVAAINLGINEFFYRELENGIFTGDSGRMAPYTALNFIFLGVAFFVHSYLKVKQKFLVLLFLVVVFTISVSAFSGYVLGTEELAGLAELNKMPVNSSALFVVLCTGLYFSMFNSKKQPTTLEYKLLAGLTFVAILILVMSESAISRIQSLKATSHRVGQALVAKDKLQQVVSEVNEMVADNRGYLLSNNEKFLMKQNQSMANINARIAELNILFSKNPERKEMLDKLLNLIYKRKQFLLLLVQTYKTSPEAAFQLLSTLQGERIADEIKLIVSQIREAENKHYYEQNEIEEQKADQTIFIILLSIALQLIFITAIFFFVKKDVLGRRKAENELQLLNEELEERVIEKTISIVNSEKRYRLTLDNLMEGCQIIGHDWKFLYINKEAEKHNQRPNEELIGHSYTDMWPGIESTEVYKRIKHCLKEKVNHRMENEFFYPDGTLGWFQLSIQSVPEGVLILSNDITEVKLAEHKAKEASIRFNNLVASLNDVVWTASSDGSEIIDVNNSFENIYGITLAELKANPKLWIEMVHPNDRPIAEASGKELYEKGKSEAEYRIVKPDGTIVWLLDKKSLIYDESGKAVQMGGIAKDITERKLAVEKLLQTEKRFRSLIEKGKDIITLANKEGKITYTSPSIQLILGYSDEEYLGSYALSYVHPDDLEEIQKHYADAFNSPGLPIHIEFRHRHKDGSYRWLESDGINRFDDPDLMAIVASSRDITERKEAEEKILLEEKRFRSLIEHSNDLIALFDETATTKYASPNIHKILGYSEDEFVGKNGFNFLHEEDLEKIKKIMAEVLAKPESEVITEFRFRCKDGTYKWFEQIGSNQLANPNLNAIITTGRDITERKALEELMREKEERFRRTLDLGVVGMATTHPFNYRFLSANKYLCNMLGYTEEELLQKTWAEITFPKEKVEEDATNLEDLLSGKLPGYVMEKQYQHKDGHLIDITLAVQGVRKADGTIDYVLTLIDDITERKKQVNFLTQQRNLGIKLSTVNNTKDLFEVSMDFLINAAGMDCGMIHLFDEEQKNLDAVYHKGLSEQFISVTSHYGVNSPITKFVMLGKPAFVNYSELPVELGEIERAEKLESFAILPIMVTDKIIGCLSLASHQINSMSSSLQNGIEVMVTLVGSTIERILKEEEILKINQSLEIKVEERTEQLTLAKSEAEQANVAKSEFLSRMSHELRTPLNSILGFAQLMEMDELEPSHVKGVQQIRKSGKHLLNLINEVLDLSRIESGKLTISLEPVCLNRIIAETMDIINPLAVKHNVNLELRKSSECKLYVFADVQKLKQVLLNLLNNAVKYNRPEGFIKVICSLHPVERIEQLTNDTEPSIYKNKLRISVVDSGKGIEKSDLNKLFTPFERIGKEISEIEGTGLGLAVAKKLIEAMNGEIGVESKIGEGSTFWIELPESESQEEIQDRITKTKPEPPQSGISGKILYIEDNYSNIELVDQVLKKHRPGIKLIVEMFGKNAVNYVTDYKPDLILLDLDLPDIHGSEVFKKLMADKNTKSIPMVVLSADAIQSQIEKLLKMGAKTYLTKPIDIEELLNVIDKMMQ